MRDMTRAFLLTALVLLSPLALHAGAPDHEVAADSLIVLLEEQAWTSDTDIGEVEITNTPGLWGPVTTWLDAGATPSTKWCRGGAAGSYWRLGLGRRLGRDEARTDVYLVTDGLRGAVGVGRLTLRTAAGLLVGGAGRAGPPSASRSLLSGRAGWRPFTGGPEPGALTGLVVKGQNGGLEVTMAAGERDRRGYVGGGGETRVGALVFGPDQRRTSVTWVRDSDGEGWSFGLSSSGAKARFLSEAAAWRAVDAETYRLSWIVSAAVDGRALGVEGQLSVREAGYDPQGGARPQVLSSDGRWGWAVRGRWRGPGISCKALMASSRGTRDIGDFPATVDVRRIELVVSGGSARAWSWRGRVAEKAETVLGWSNRQPWLAPAEVSSRRVTRLSLRVSGSAGETSIRMTAGGVGVSRRDDSGEVESGWRQRAALRIDRLVGAGVRLRFNQVWAWGEAVDLVSVEVPTPGFMRPRHWGRRDRERSLGVCWRGGGWRLSAAVAAWDVADEGSEMEVLVGLNRRR